MKLFLSTAALSMVLAGTAHAEVKELSGVGATFPYPVYAKWAEAYAKETGIKINYQAIGSGGGIKQIKAKTVDFGASDKPLKKTELDKFGLIQFPMVMGGVVPVVNVKGIKAGKLRLDGPLLADIFMGKVSKWNDKKIVAMNKGLSLPDTKITVVHRADGSGTTWNFTNYLSKISVEWKEKIGNSKSVAWPSGVGGKGNAGIASYVKRIDGAIGYVEFAYAVQNKMSYALMKNKAGKFIAPTSEAFQAAAAGADWAGTPGFRVVLTDQPGDDSWPITAATFILLYKKQDKPEVGQAVLKFFDWCYDNGAKMAKALDYVPMPASAIALVRDKWKEIK